MAEAVPTLVAAEAFMEVAAEDSTEEVAAEARTVAVTGKSSHSCARAEEDSPQPIFCVDEAIESR